MVTIGNAHEHYANLPEQHLYHMATNDSVRPEFKKVAVKLMLEKGYKSAYKPEFADIRKTLEAPPEPETVAEVPASSPALKASFTTASINPTSEIVPAAVAEAADESNIITDSVQKTDEPAIPEPANEAATSVANPSI